MAPAPTIRSLTPQAKPGRRIGRAEILDERHLRKFLRHDESVRENCGVLGLQPVKGLERQFHFHAARDVEKSSRPHECLVQRGELGGAERGRLAHEMTPEQLFVLDHCPLERLKDDAGLTQLFRKNVAFQKMIVGKNKPARGFIKSDGALENFATIGVGQRAARRVGRKIERADIREAPCLIGPRRHGQALELCPGRALLIAKPGGQCPVVYAFEGRRGCQPFPACEFGGFFEDS